MWEVTNTMTTITIDKLLLEQVQDLLYRVTRWKGENHEVLTDLHDIKEAVKAVLAAPATAPERKPMTDKEIAGAIVRSPDPMAFGKLPAEGWRPMVRLVEAFHGITKLAPTGPELPSKQADQMEVTSQGQVPAWHDAPTVPGDWICDEGDICYTWTAHNIEILDQFDPGDGLRWYGPIPEDRQ